MLGREVWLTWLRRPLARTVSEYLHAKANLVVWDYAMPATFLEFVTSREYAVGAQNRMVRMLGGRAQPLADDMEGRVATDLAKQRLKMTTFLGLFGTETLVSICEDVFEHREEGCWRRLKHGALPNAEAPRHREQLYEHEIAMHKVTQKLMAANSLDPRRGAQYEFASDLLTERLHTMRARGMALSWHGVSTSPAR